MLPKDSLMFKVPICLLMFWNGSSVSFCKSVNYGSPGSNLSPGRTSKVQIDTGCKLFLFLQSWDILLDCGVGYVNLVRLLALGHQFCTWVMKWLWATNFVNYVHIFESLIEGSALNNKKKKLNLYLYKSKYYFNDNEC